MDFSPKFSYRDTNKRWKKENEKPVKERERNSRMSWKEEDEKGEKKKVGISVSCTQRVREEKEGGKRRYEKLNLVSVGGKRREVYLHV